MNGFHCSSRKLDPAGKSDVELLSKVTREGRLKSNRAYAPECVAPTRRRRKATTTTTKHNQKQNTPTEFQFSRKYEKEEKKVSKFGAVQNYLFSDQIRLKFGTNFGCHYFETTP